MYFGLLYILSIAMIISVIPIVFIGKDSDKGLIDPKLFMVIISFGLLLVTIYFGSSDYLYGFDAPSEARHILESYYSGRFKFTLSAFSNVLALVNNIPIFLEFSGADMVTFYKFFYPLILSLIAPFYYLVYKSSKLPRRFVFLGIILGLSTYVYFYGFLSSIKYGFSFPVFLTLLLMLSKNLQNTKGYIIMLLVSISITLLYYTVGILALIYVATASILFLIGLEKQSDIMRRNMIYITVISGLVALLYWFYYAQATQQHLVSALKHLLYSTSERIETKSTFITANIGDQLPIIGTYIKTGTMGLILLTALAGYIVTIRRGIDNIVSMSRIALIALIPSIVSIGFILGLYYTLHFYWWGLSILSVSFIYWLSTTKIFSKDILKKTLYILLIALIVLNLSNQLLITNKIFHMRGAEIIDRIVYGRIALLTATVNEYESIKSIIALSDNYIVILPDIFARPAVYQVLILERMENRKIYISLHLEYPLNVEKNTLIYISPLNLEEETFYMTRGGYGTPIPLNKVFSYKENSIVYDSGSSLLVK